ncbi:hypothetical protein QEH54_06105 [Pelagicoccus sp. SDUM812003]|nr:hypothetical protein [Pelagicoccus sp. SDUM812003]
MNFHRIHHFFLSLLTPPVNKENLTAYYSSASDGELSRLKPSELTPEALPLWKAEMARRQAARRTKAMVK